MDIGFGKGYDERVPLGRNKGSNGFLMFANDKIPLWVSDVTVEFGLGGSTAQSSNTRTLFPRSLTQPEFRITCQSPNQVFYSQTQEFIRKCQRGFSNLTELFVNGGGTGRFLKGYHKPINATGYIRTTTREHERFVYAPEFTFAFIVADLASPHGWGDDLVTVRKLKSWQAIVEGIMAHDQNAGFVNDPDKITPTSGGNGTPGNRPITLPNGKVLPS